MARGALLRTTTRSPEFPVVNLPSLRTVCVLGTMGSGPSDRDSAAKIECSIPVQGIRSRPLIHGRTREIRSCVK
jgi:hypothetical protein